MGFEQDETKVDHERVTTSPLSRIALLQHAALHL